MHHVANVLQRFLVRETRIFAINASNSAALQFIQGNADGVQIQMHGAKECTPRQKVEPGKNDERRSLQISLRQRELQFPHVDQSIGLLRSEEHTSELQSR